MKREPTLIYSPLNCQFTKDGVTVEVCIISSDADPKWALEVINASGTSIVWDDLFLSDEAAYAAFTEVVAKEGMVAFMDKIVSDNIIPFPQRH